MPTRRLIGIDERLQFRETLYSCTDMAHRCPITAAEQRPDLNRVPDRHFASSGPLELKFVPEDYRKKIGPGRYRNRTVTGRSA